jgi:hypothetical protein
MKSFDEFISVVDAKLKINTTESRKEVLLLLKNKVLRSVIELVINDNVLLKEVSNRSYFHKNGFLKVLLIDMRPKYSVRLHIWPTDPFSETDIHDHPWNMTGLVLNGSYNWNVFEESQSSDLFVNRYICNYLDDYSGHFLKKGHSVFISLVNVLSFVKGEFFDFSHKELHNVEKKNYLPADSIVITGENISEYAQVITSREIKTDKVIFNSAIDDFSLKNSLVDFLTRI